MCEGIRTEMVLYSPLEYRIVFSWFTQNPSDKWLNTRKFVQYGNTFHKENLGTSSVAHPDLGPGALLTPGPGSGIQNRFIPDPGFRIPDFGSRIPNPYFLELSDKFLINTSIVSISICKQIKKLYFHICEGIRTNTVPIVFLSGILMVYLESKWSVVKYYKNLAQ
jgi:hypothetical protein